MRTGPLRVLCVDDDHDIRTITVMALGLDGGIDARGVASGSEALALLEAQGWWPDVILLDVMMSEMTGPALLTAIRERQGIDEVPVIFMTARAGRSALEEYRDLGALGVIIKPFDPVRLAGEVREMLGGEMC
jgi:two-component system, OmpR family, response regulator